jgi:hypothetical protein
MILGLSLRAYTIVHTVIGFPIHEIGPPHIIGAISLVILAIAVAARYAFKMNGAWRSTYVITALIACNAGTF